MDDDRVENGRPMQAGGMGQEAGLENPGCSPPDDVPADASAEKSAPTIVPVEEEDPPIWGQPVEPPGV